MKAGIDTKFQKSTFSAIKLNGMFSTSFGPFHYRDPFFIIAEQVKVQVRADSIRLSTDG